MSDLSIRDRILDAAEIRARRGGYGGFSFREIADDVGVKSSSVHYHFPTKADLAEVMVKRYTERAMAFLGEAAEFTPAQAIERVTQLFRNALTKEDKMCLCGLFGAERDGLPVEVSSATATFFRLIIAYLQQAFGPDWIGENPTAILARLEGGLIVARTLGDVSVFEDGGGSENGG